MTQLPNFDLIEKIYLDYEIANNIFKELLHQFQVIFKLRPHPREIEVVIAEAPPDIEFNIFNFGIFKERNCLIIRKDKETLQFLPFIFIREIFRYFIDDDLRENISINLALNQMVITLLTNHPKINEWKSKIREEIEKFSRIHSGVDYLTNFDRLNRFFNIKVFNFEPNPFQFFIEYLNDHPQLVKDKFNTFNYIFLKNYKEKVLSLMISNPFVETLYSIIYIFFNTKNYTNLLQYKEHFKSFKEQGLLLTELSLRKFTENMNLIKKTSISPSYMVNWGAINIEVIIFVMKFNPLLGFDKIKKILRNFPFINSPKMSLEGFTITTIGFIILPMDYLNDCLEFMEYLKKKNYLIDYSCFSRINQIHNINLNYFKEDFVSQIIPNPSYKKYKKKLEISFEFNYTEQYNDENLSILDFLILDRIRWYSFSGLGFERREESIKTLKSDLFNEIISQRSFISRLKANLRALFKEKDLRKEVINVIINHIESGFFILKEKLEIYLDVIKNLNTIILKENIQEYGELVSYLQKNHPSVNLEQNLIFINNSQEIQSILEEIFQDFFISKPNYSLKVQIFKYCDTILDLCSALKLYDLNRIIEIISNEKLAFNIFQAKDKKLEEIFKEYQVKGISSGILDNIIDKFLENNPPIISPILINTIITDKFESDYFQLLVSYFNDIEEYTSKLTFLFPRTIVNKLRNLKTEKYLYFLEISLPSLKKKEKFLFVSFIANFFGKNLIYGKNHLWSGLITGFSARNFYDYEKKNFFYTVDLYKHYTLFFNSSFQKIDRNFNTTKFENWKELWLDGLEIIDIIKNVNDRITKENPIYDLSLLDKLLSFHSNLKENLLNIITFTEKKKSQFFMNYVKSIEFFPCFKAFNLDRTIIYFYCNDLNQINFTSLLQPNFLKIEYPAFIDESLPFLFEYLKSNPSDNCLLDHSLGSENNIREYCEFICKRIHLLFHFELNFTPEGWNYDSINFKEHLQNVLFNDVFSKRIPNPKYYDFKKISQYKLNSTEFLDLSEIFNYQSIDIKSYIGTKKIKTIERIQDLLKKELIFPYIKLKNLGFQECIYIIIPSLDQNLVDVLLKIFGWFNYGFIHEIEGKYFIYGFDEPIEFTHGLMMKIYFPKCELSEFKQLFDMVFEYLQVDHYLILKDFVNGDTLVKNIFEDPDFFKTHHPLRNVKYDGKDV
ncbi:MAG: hypothetical protein ACTSR7_18335 [Promethearchaeota archaeon]